jgi:hypothetical protein
MKRFLLSFCLLTSLCWATNVHAQCTGTFAANQVCGTIAGGLPRPTPSTSFPIGSTALDSLCSTNNDFLIRLSGTWQCGATGTSGHAVPFLDGTNSWSGANTWSNTQTYAAGSFLNNQTTLLPTSGDANNAYAAFFNPCVNATTFPCSGVSALPSTGVVFNLNRVKVGEASLASSDYLITGLPSTPSWLDTLMVTTGGDGAVVGTSQLASGSYNGATGIVGYARTSDWYKYAVNVPGNPGSSGTQGGVFIAYNDDTLGLNPIADATLMIGIQHSGGTGLTTLSTQIDINAATQQDIQAYATGGNPDGGYFGETIGALITSGAYNFAAANPSAAIFISFGDHSHPFRKGIVVGPTALDQTVGCGGSCGIFADLPGGGDSSGKIASIRWSNPTPGVDSEIWGDQNGFNVNSNERVVGLITEIFNGVGGAAVPNANGDGLRIVNNTAAANNSQQNSPNIHLIGQGWKTNSTPASQTVDWLITNQPVQGAAAPSTQLLFSSQINGGGFIPQIIVNSSGALISNQNTNVPSALALSNGGIGVIAIGGDSAVTGFNVLTFGSLGANSFVRSDGTEASPTALLSGEEIARFGFGGATSSTTSAFAKARISAFAAENWSTTAFGTYLSIFTTITGGGTPSTTEKFRFQASGGLNVGNHDITLDPGAGNAILSGNGSSLGGTAAFYYVGTEMGRIQAGASGMALLVNAGATFGALIWTSGGTYFGATPTDPGTNNVAVQANMKAASYTVGSTAGASCTLTTVSHLTVVNGLVTVCN